MPRRPRYRAVVDGAIGNQPDDPKLLAARVVTQSSLLHMRSVRLPSSEAVLSRRASSPLFGHFIDYFAAAIPEVP